MRNPHYDPILRPRTGLDPEVGAYIEADPDFAAFFATMADLIDLLLPRFVQEGKKYATITIGCTGGRHRSVYLVEKLAQPSGGPDCRRAGVRRRRRLGWRVHVTHRELAAKGYEAAYLTERPVPRPERHSDLDATRLQAAPVQAQEA